MAKKVIVLNISDKDGYIYVQTAFWFPVIGTPVARTNATSAYTGATSAELSQLSSGQILEEVNTFTFPHGVTQAAVQNNIVALYNARLAFLAAQLPANQFYGLSYDGTVWT